MQASWFPDWRGVYGSEHLPGILCTSWNMFSGGRLNKKDGLTRYGDSHVNDKTS